MAQNNDKQEEKTAIENVNETLTNAGQKLADNKTVIGWIVGGVFIIAALIIGYMYFYRTPHVNKAYEAYNQVEISAAGNDSIAAAQYKKVADENKGNTAGKLAALSACLLYTSPSPRDCS